MVSTSKQPVKERDMLLAKIITTANAVSAVALTLVSAFAAFLVAAYLSRRR